MSDPAVNLPEGTGFLPQSTAEDIIQQNPDNPGQIQIKIPLEEIRKKKLFLAVPMYGGQAAGLFTRSVLDLSAMCALHGIPLQVYFLFNESLVTRARNYCVDEFMRSGSTHLMFIDSDIGFDPKDVLALLALSSDSSPYDVIGAPYPKKTISWEKIKLAVDKGVADKDPNVLENFVGDYVFNPKARTNQIALNKPVEVLEIGTGFMLIRRKTLEDYAKYYPELFYRPDHVRTEHFDGSRFIQAAFDVVIDRGYTFGEVHRFLEMMASHPKPAEAAETFKTQALKFLETEKNSTMRYLSEDYMFCQNVIRMGGSVWFCPWMRLQHVGSYVFGGSLVDLASVGANATADPNVLKKNRENSKKK